MELDQIINISPFKLKSKDKNKMFRKYLSKLFDHHINHSDIFKSFIKGLNFKHNLKTPLEHYPFLPIRFFKEYEIKSITNNKIFKTLKSSGTSSQNLSKIFLDKKNSQNQIKVLTKITSNFIGKKRLPFLIIDTVKSNNYIDYSARAAGITGFSIFGKDITYALNENMQINIKKLNHFLKKYKNEKFLIFSFTSVLWEYFIENLKKNDLKYNFENGTLIHGGGWKKLQEKNINNIKFNKTLKEYMNLNDIINYYGMVEQTGSIFFECKYRFFHCSVFSDIFIRKKDFSLCKNKEIGIIQLLSLIPTSYPGNSIITEDMGEIVGEDNCKCGRAGKYFKFHGRVKNAELRGCSDTY